MPAPYSLIAIPEGGHKDIFDAQAMNMAVIHNRTFFSFRVELNLQTEKIHPHHIGEEELYFPEIEKRLGIHTMDSNVDQHKTFLSQLENFPHYMEDYMEGVYAGTVKYESEVVVGKLNTFTDPLMIHMNDVRLLFSFSISDYRLIENQHRKSRHSASLRKVMTQAEMEAIDKAMVKRVIAETSFSTTIPLFMVLNNAEDAPWFNPLPSILIWAVRVWFHRKYKDAAICIVA
ncbi:hypothetical protein C8J56DRAFT_1033378 [Mycena floridula]|nr:hypothetical protein C8J56DRAFT_1033378 [Mycena floridula]